MSIILPTHLRAPFIAPGRRNRKVHWNRERSKSIVALGKYEREDWHRGLTWPQGLFGLAEKYFAKKNNPGCTCCDTTPDNSCADALDCYDGAWGGGSIPSEAEVETPTMVDDRCTGFGAGCPDFEGTYILNWNGSLFDYSEFFTLGGPCTFASDIISIALEILCSGSQCSYEGTISIDSRDGITDYSQCYLYRPSVTPKGSSLPWSLDFVDNSCPTTGGVLVDEACTLSGPFVVTGFA